MGLGLSPAGVDGCCALIFQIIYTCGILVDRCGLYDCCSDTLVVSLIAWAIKMLVG